MHTLLEKLIDGDLRSKGNSDMVVTEIGDDPELFAVVFEGMFEHDPGLRLRALHVIEQVCRSHPYLLQVHKDILLEGLPEFEKHPEMHMLVPLLLGKIKSDLNETALIWETLKNWLAKFSKTFARVNCLQALADQAILHPEKKAEAIWIIEEEMEKGSASIRARGRKLLKILNK